MGCLDDPGYDLPSCLACPKDNLALEDENDVIVKGWLLNRTVCHGLPFFLENDSTIKYFRILKKILQPTLKLAYLVCNLKIIK